MRLTGFDGTLAIVTGAAQGIGAALCRQLAMSGACVALFDRQDDALRRTADELSRDGAVARAWSVDVSDAEAIEAAVADVEATLGPVAMLANVAGIVRSAPALKLTSDDWARMIAVNLYGVVNCSRAVAQRMVERGAGRIVTVASQSGEVLRMEQAAYGASKAAAEYYTKCLGLELAPFGIRCNVVNPGVCATPLAETIWRERPAARQAHITGDLSRYRAPIPLRKVGQPDDVANAIMFLLSDQAGHIALADLRVDGGSALLA